MKLTVREINRQESGETLSLLLLSFALMLLALDSSAWWLYVIAALVFAAAVWTESQEGREVMSYSLTFDVMAALLRWHEAGRPDPTKADVRLDSVETDASGEPIYYAVLHLATGLTVVCRDGAPLPLMLTGLREAMHVATDRILLVHRHQVN